MKNLNENQAQPSFLRDTSKMKTIDDFKPPTAHGRRMKLAPDSLRMSVWKGGTKSSRKNAVWIMRIAFGSRILNTMRWQRGDRIQVYFDDDYIFLRRDARNGYTLTAANKKKQALAFNLPIYPGMPLSNLKEPISARDVEYVREEDGLLACWPTPD